MGRGAARSKIDEWDSKLKAHWSQGEAAYITLLPQGREPFTSGGRDNIVAEVGSFAERLGNATGPLGVEQSALLVQIDAIVMAGDAAGVADRCDGGSAGADPIGGVAASESGGLSRDAGAGAHGAAGQGGAGGCALDAGGGEARGGGEKMYGHLGTLMAHFKVTPGRSRRSSISIR